METMKKLFKYLLSHGIDLNFVTQNMHLTVVFKVWSPAYWMRSIPNIGATPLTAKASDRLCLSSWIAGLSRDTVSRSPVKVPCRQVTRSVRLQGTRLSMPSGQQLS